MFRMAIRTVLSLLLATFLGAPRLANAEEIVAAVTIVHSPDWRPCVFIQVQGRPLDWFALSITQQGYKEALMLLTLSYATSANAWITTYPGDQACGYPRVIATRLVK